MTKYVVANVTVTDHQKRKMVSAVHSKSPFSLKLTNAQLSGGPDDLHVTPRQKNKMAKHAGLGKGIVLKFSARQLSHMAKKGGFLLPLLAGLAGTMLPGLIRTGVDFVAKKASGNGFSKPDDDDEHEGGFLVPLLLSLLGGAAASTVSSAVEGGLRKQAGLNNNIIGTGLTQLGHGMDLPIKKKKNSYPKMGNGLYQLGKQGSGRMQAYQNSDSLRVI
jgi:hypothetical protein